MTDFLDSAEQLSPISRKHAPPIADQESLLLGAQVEGARFTSGYFLPLMICPEQMMRGKFYDIDSNLETFTLWLRENRTKLVKTVLNHGAILFRGFCAREPEQFDAIRQALPFVPMPYVGGAAVRKLVFGEHLFTTNESPPSEPVPFHHELSQTSVPPDYITFFCQKPPQAGGETPLVDSRAVYCFMAKTFPEFTDKLNKLGVKYVRTLPKEDDSSSAIGRSWPSTWQTDSRAQAEKKMLAEGISWEWLENGNLKTITRALPATRQDPRTGITVFFNSMIAAYKGWIDSRNDPKKAVRFGDDSELPCDVLETLFHYMTENAVSIPWCKGDILLIDNWVVMHARNPFKGPRKILAAIGQRLPKP